MSNLVILNGPNGVRLVPCSGFRFLPGEKVIGSATLFNKARIEQMEVPPTQPEPIGVGDLAHKILTTSGFKSWWDKYHKGACLPCKQRQAYMNYLTFKGPEWLSKWVKDNSG